MKNLTLYTGTTSTAVATLASSAFDLGDLTCYSIEVVFSGGATDLVGTLTLEASNDNTTFTTVTGSSQAITASAAHMWNVVGAGYRWVRVRWTFTSGTGNMQAYLSVKENRVVGA